MFTVIRNSDVMSNLEFDVVQNLNVIQFMCLNVKQIYTFIKFSV